MTGTLKVNKNDEKNKEKKNKNFFFFAIKFFLLKIEKNMKIRVYSK